MKKMLVALLLMLVLTLSLGQQKALADCSNETINTGAATVVTQLYESQCAILGWGSGIITKDMQANCCGPSAVIRVNLNDWNKLATEGKIDGLRYIYVPKDKDGTYQIGVKKMTSGKPALISGADFFK